MQPSNPPTLNYATPSLAGDRPWIPVQLVGITFLFGPVAGGVAAGINFGRMGQKGLMAICAIVGSVVFLAEALVIAFVADDRAIRPIGMAINITTGLGFMLAQKGVFAKWQASNWRPMVAGEKYRPNRIGLLFGVGLACLVAEVAVLLVLLLASGRV